MLATKHLKDRLEDLVGRSPAMQTVFSRLRKAAACDVPVILFGPKGSGKHLAARTLHDLSSRKNGPFVAITTADDPNRLQRRLFGEQEAGTPTRGLVTAANGGTLYIDEVANLDHAHQVGLLRILDTENHFRHAFRLVAATRHDPEALLASGRIREDFHYRIHVIPIRMPPLSERPEDLPLLVAALSRRMGLHPLSPDNLELLFHRPLPGNVAELVEVIREMTTTQADAPDLTVNPTLTAGSLKEAMNAFERAVILRTLQKAKGNLTRTASLLGVHRKTLANKIDAHGLRSDLCPLSDPP